MEEANKLLGSGKKHLVMGEVVEAVRVLQEACSILAKTYGDTADECGEAFFWCGKALLDLAQMENSVLGNALEGVPEEDEEKPKDCNVESTENIDEKTRDELRVQVYDAMAEKKTEGNERTDAENATDRKLNQAVDEQEADKKTDDVGGSKVAECEDENTDKKAEIQGEPADKEEPSEDSGKVDGSKSSGSEDKENEAGGPSEPAVKDHDGSKSSGREEDSAEKDSAEKDSAEKDSAEKDSAEKDSAEKDSAEKDSAEKDSAEKDSAEKDSAEKGAIDGSSLPESGDKRDGADEAKDENESLEKQEESVSKPEEAEAGDEEGGADVEMTSDTEAEGEAAEKDSDEEEVGNLQLAWEMLEVAKVIYKRKDTKEDQLMAAQAHLKLGEVSAESGNYTRALEDFQECLKLQLKYLDSDSRLLAETHYQLGLTYSLNCQYSQAIEELNASISVIKSRLDKLQELIDKAEGPEDLPDERKEMEELKALLPEIQEKVEDATEALKTSSSDAEAVKDVLRGGSMSSGAPDSTVKNCDSSSSSVTEATSATGVSTGTGQTSTVPVTDISHLVRKKRKPEESPVKASEEKKVKHDDGDADALEEPHSIGVHADTSSMKVESL